MVRYRCCGTLASGAVCNKPVQKADKRTCKTSGRIYCKGHYPCKNGCVCFPPCSAAAEPAAAEPQATNIAAPSSGSGSSSRYTGVPLSNFMPNWLSAEPQAVAGMPATTDVHLLAVSPAVIPETSAAAPAAISKKRRMVAQNERVGNFVAELSSTTPVKFDGRKIVSKPVAAKKQKEWWRALGSITGGHASQAKQVVGSALNSSQMRQVPRLRVFVPCYMLLSTFLLLFVFH